MQLIRPSTRQKATTGAFVVLSIAFTSVANAQIADTSFILIRPVTFQMGDEVNRPRHTVDISRGFLLQKTEVRQALPALRSSDRQGERYRISARAGPVTAVIER